MKFYQKFVCFTIHDFHLLETGPFPKLYSVERSSLEEKYRDQKVPGQMTGNEQDLLQCFPDCSTDTSVETRLVQCHALGRSHQHQKHSECKTMVVVRIMPRQGTARLIAGSFGHLPLPCCIILLWWLIMTYYD